MHNFHRTPLVTHGPYDYEVLFGEAGGDGQPGETTAPVPDVEVGAPQQSEESFDDGTQQPT
jgi:cytochrome c oxidase subunit 1